METYRLADMTKGWFVGNFSPTALKTTGAEVSYRPFTAGQREPRHVHKVATEVSVIVEGRVRINGQEYSAGDIIVLSPHEAAEFEALTDGSSVIVKVPSVIGDKYVLEP